MSDARRACVVAIMIASTVASRAAVMTAPGMELSASDLDAAGGPGFSDPSGSNSLSYALCQAMGAALLQSGAVDLSGGIYGGFGAGSGVGVGSVLAGGGACPSLRLLNQTLLGVPKNQSVCVSFNRLLLPNTLTAATQVRIVMDKDGVAVSTAVATQSNYQLSPSQLQIFPASSWANNSLYTVAIGTGALDQDGVPLSTPTVFQFQTLADPAVANTFLAMGDPSTRLTLAPNVLPSQGHLEINADPIAQPTSVSPAVIQSATAKLQRDQGPFSQVFGVRELNFFDASSQPAPLVFPAGGASLAVSFQDANKDGIVDGSNPPARVSSLGLYALDESKALWVRLPNSSAGAGGAVTAAIPHLSVYALISAQDTSLASAFVFPVPFRPHGPNAGAGSGQTGTDAGGITFANLPQPVTVEVYNVLGERVWSAADASGAGQLVWNTKNSAGQNVASGVYVYLIRNTSNDHISGKLMIIR